MYWVNTLNNSNSVKYTDFSFGGFHIMMKANFVLVSQQLKENVLYGFQTAYIFIT